MRQHSRPILTRSTHSMLALAAALVVLAAVLVACGVPQVSAHAGSMAGVPATPSPSATPSNSAAATTTPSPVAPPSPTARPTPPALPSPTPVPTAPPLPDLPAVAACTAGQDQPSALFVEFCAPIYDGTAEGPNGTNVTVVLAYNFLAPPDALYFFSATAKLPAGSTDLSSLCPPADTPNPPAKTGEGPTCFQVMSPEDVRKQLGSTPPNQRFVLHFTLKAPDDASQHDYNVVYTTASKQPPTQSPKPFTVKSPDSPCVTISLAASAPGGRHSGDASPSTSTCAPQDTPIYVDPGSTAPVWIQGANWLPYDKVHVVVTATCVGLCSLYSFKLNKDVIKPQQDGSFLAQASIQPSAEGYYAIRAWSTASDSQNTAADRALCFSCAEPQAASSAALVIAPRIVTVQDCASSPCTVPEGSTLTVSGQYWQPGPAVQIYLIKTGKCTGQTGSLPHTTASVGPDAKFTKPLGLAGLKAGKDAYGVCANDLLVIQSLKIGPATAAAPVGTAMTLSWIALALALASLGLYLVVPHRRAI